MTCPQGRQARPGLPAAGNQRNGLAKAFDKSPTGAKNRRKENRTLHFAPTMNNNSSNDVTGQFTHLRNRLFETI